MVINVECTTFWSMAAVSSRLLQNDRLPPAESEVADGEAGDDGHAEPAVVRHEDEHDEVREYHLQGRYKLQSLRHSLLCQFCTSTYV